MQLDLNFGAGPFNNVQIYDSEMSHNTGPIEAEGIAMSATTNFIIKNCNTSHNVCTATPTVGDTTQGGDGISLEGWPGRIS